MKTLKFGIELETTGLDKDGLARAIHSVTGGTLTAWGSQATVVTPDGRTWKVVPDGSLSGYTNGEIVSPVLTYGDIDQLQDIVRAVRHAGARVDQSTGIHLHLGAERFDAKAVVNLIKMVNKQERILERALAVDERRLSKYCKPVNQEFLREIEAHRPRTMADLSAAWYGRPGVTPTRYDRSRYHGINLNSLFYRKTIEIRLFNGSLHAGEVKAYVQLLLALGAKALASKATSSKKREYNEGSAKYDFRTWLLALKMVGPEFKTARYHLLKHLGGSTAWKNGRPTPRRAAAPTEGA